MRHRNRRLWPLLIALALAAGTVGCAKYNLFWNAKKAFDQAELVRKERVKAGEDVTEATSVQVTNYNVAIDKCKKLLAEYPGHGLTDDALFLMAKSYHRLQSYRQSILRLDLLFQNFPATEYTEEALYLQAANHMLIGDVRGADDFLGRLTQSFPDSRFQSEVLRVSGDNAFALEHWETARDSYARYLGLDLEDDDERRPQAAYNLAVSHWRLGEYLEAHDRLEALIAGPEMKAELLFQARLLQVRCLSRIGRFEDAEALIDLIDPDAEAYSSEGLVALAGAEALVLQGRSDEARTKLESMPDEWITGDAKALRGEMLGALYLESWEIEEAEEQYGNAVHKPRILEDPDRCRGLADALGDFVDAGVRMESAADDRLPGYKLQRANILYFHLDRPDLALELYRDVAASAELDSSAAVRGLYGAAIIYRDELAEPDSVSVMLARLRESYPDAPQTFMLESSGDGDLFEFVMERDREVRESQIEIAATAEENPGVEEEAVDVPPPPESREPGVRYSRWRERKLRRHS